MTKLTTNNLHAYLETSRVIGITHHILIRMKYLRTIKSEEIWTRLCKSYCIKANWLDSVENTELEYAAKHIRYPTKSRLETMSADSGKYTYEVRKQGATALVGVSVAYDHQTYDGCRN